MVNCSVLGCTSRTLRQTPNITFHRFPKDNNIRNAWISICGRKNWNPSNSSRLCSKHFEEECFRKTAKVTLLRPGSIPKLYVHDIAEQSVSCSEKTLPSGCVKMTHDVSQQPVSSTTEATQASHDSMTRSLQKKQLDYTPRKRKLAIQLQRKTRLADIRKSKLAQLRSRNWRLQKKNADLSNVIEKLKSRSLINQEGADILSNIDPLNKDIINRVLGTSTEKKYSPALRQFALSLHFMSPRAYDFVRKTFDSCLPHPRTLRGWYQSVDGEPGFSKESLNCIKMLSCSSTRKFFGALCFDEMAIRKFVEFDGKKYVGFVNTGNNLDSNSLPVAKEVLVFMLTCINGSWKIPVGYFLIDGISAEQKASLVKQALDLIEEAGISVISVTFDGCPANFSMAKILGCCLDDEKIDSTFVSNGKRVAVFPDPSHMLKLVRNTLGEKNILTTEDGKAVSWEYIKLLVELQEKEGFHLANKLKNSHIFFKKQIMKVKLAAQTLSQSVADAIEFCAENLEIESFKNSKATVDFIRKFNDLFDLMNSRNLKSFGYKKPLNDNNFEENKKIMLNVCKYIKSLKLGDTPILKSNRKTGFLGFIICIHSLIHLYEDFVKPNPHVNFLCSYKLSQDHLEYFFSAIRAKGGFNNNPTARQFQAAYKRLLVHGELKHITSGNSIPLSDISILTYTKPEVAINRTTDRERLMSDETIELSIESDELALPPDHDYLADPTKVTEFARQVIIYIAGFVVRKVQSQLKCQECISALYQDPFPSLQAKKDKGGLLYPSTDIVNICEIAEKVYKANKYYDKNNPLQYLLRECLKKCINLDLFKSITQHFTDQSGVDNHYGLLIKLICTKYLKVRIHYIAKNYIKKDDNVRNLYTKLILFKGQ